MRKAHRPQITNLFKKHHTLTPKFKGTVDGGSLLYTGERETRDFSWPVHEVFFCSRSVKSRRFLTHILKTQLLKTQHICTGACTKIRVANDTVLDVTKPQFLSNSDNQQIN